MYQRYTINFNSGNLMTIKKKIIGKVNIWVHIELRCEVLVKGNLLLLRQLTNACLEHFWIGL